MNRIEYDVIGIGFGPGNIALAISLEEKKLSSVLFIEGKSSPDWQPEMLLDGADIQHNPLRDFVTPRNPVSPYGFLSYLKEEGRLFEYLNLGLEFPLRKDYARYVRWVAQKFEKWVSYGERVVSIAYDIDDPIYWRIDTSLNRTLYARSISFAPGRTPYIPPVFEERTLSRVAHFTRYISSLSQWQHESEIKSIAIIGSSQSAIELVLDVSARFPNIKIHNILRGYSYQLKDVSPFTEEIYFPGFIDDFYNLSIHEQQKLTQSLWRSNYSAADHDVIHSLYTKMYEHKIDGRDVIQIHNMSDVISVKQSNRCVELVIKHKFSGKEYTLTVDGVILATGFRNMGGDDHQEQYPPLLSDIAQQFKRRVDGSLHVNRDYSLESNSITPPLYLNGLCESTHGFGDAGSFSLLSLRSWSIAESIENYFYKK